MNKKIVPIIMIITSVILCIYGISNLINLYDNQRTIDMIFTLQPILIILISLGILEKNNKDRNHDKYGIGEKK